MPFSNYALNIFATRLSKLTAPNIPELVLDDRHTLSNYLLESTFGVFNGKGNAKARHRLSNMVRRIFAAIETYELGRQYALEYVSGNRHERITPYFRALTQFETCVSYSWQTIDLLIKGSGQKVFEPGDESAWERLYLIYTKGNKHSHSLYDETLDEEMPTTIWMTNDGLACVYKDAKGENQVKECSLTFKELSEIIDANNDMFYRIQRRARERQQEYARQAPRE